MIRSICILFCALLLTAFGSGAFAQLLHEQPLVVGWYQNPPFMEFADHLEGDVEGAEVRFARALMKDLGRPVIFRFVPERQVHQALAVGTIDVALNAKNTKEMRQVAHLSSPYRIESDLAVFREGTVLDRLTQQGEARILEILDRAMLEGAGSEGERSPAAAPSFQSDLPSLLALRVGVIEGHSYGEPSDLFIARHLNSERLVKLNHAIAVGESLDGGDIDVAFIDGVIHQMFLSAGFYRYEHQFQSEPLHQEPAHVAFSKATVPEEFMKEVEKSLARLPDLFGDHATAVTVIEPWVINRSLTSAWYFWLDIIGTLAFAMSGIIIARQEKYSVFGAFVLASLPAVGGGVLRDLLVNRHPIGILETPLYLYLLVAVILVAKVLIEIHSRLMSGSTRYAEIMKHPHVGHFRITSSFTLNVTDAIGLAVFTVTGVSIAFAYKAYPLWLWAPLLAVLTSSAGGILRDTIRSYKRIPALTTSVYPEISVLCGLGMTLALLSSSSVAGIGPDLIIVATIVTAFTLRMLVVVLDIRPLRL